MEANQTPNVTDVQTFHFEDAHQVRAKSIDGEPWFVAVDVCRILGITNNRDAVRKLDSDERIASVKPTHSRGNQTMWHVNESGLYTLIFRCRDAVKPGTAAHRFRKWVTSEVLPSIRKTGAYSIDRTAEIEELTAEVEKWKAWAVKWKNAGKEYSAEAERWRDAAKAAQNRYNAYTTTLCRQRKKNGSTPPATYANPYEKSPCDGFTALFAALCEIKVGIDVFYENDELMRDRNEAYRSAETDLNSAIGSLSQYVGHYATDHFIRRAQEKLGA